MPRDPVKTTESYIQDPNVPYDQNSRQANAAHVLREQTFNAAINLLRQREKAEGARTERWRTLAKVYLTALIDGKPLSHKVPPDVYDWASRALTQACESTGYIAASEEARRKEEEVSVRWRVIPANHIIHDDTVRHGELCWRDRAAPQKQAARAGGEMSTSTTTTVC